MDVRQVTAKKRFQVTLYCGGFALLTTYHLPWMLFTMLGDFGCRR
jgi:hypothetical protein